MAGDYEKYRRHYERIDADLVVAAGDAGPSTLKAVRNANYTIFVQKIKVSVTTFSAKTWTFKDSAGTPVPGAVISTTAPEATVPGIQDYEFDFGAAGYPLTQGKDLAVAYSAAGAAGIVHVEAYQRKTAVTYIGDTSANQ